MTDVMQGPVVRPRLIRGARWFVLALPFQFAPLAAVVWGLSQQSLNEGMIHAALVPFAWFFWFWVMVGRFCWKYPDSWEGYWRAPRTYFRQFFRAIPLLGMHLLVLTMLMGS